MASFPNFLWISSKPEAFRCLRDIFFINQVSSALNLIVFDMNVFVETIDSYGFTVINAYFMNWMHKKIGISAGEIK